MKNARYYWFHMGIRVHYQFYNQPNTLSFPYKDLQWAVQFLWEVIMPCSLYKRRTCSSSGEMDLMKCELDISHIEVSLFAWLILWMIKGYLVWLYQVYFYMQYFTEPQAPNGHNSSYTPVIPTKTPFYFP